MDFLDKFKKEVKKIEGVTDSSVPPKYWFGTGNHVLNYILSGNFNNGIAQGRIANLSGSSATGKSFLMANIAREAQKDGAFVYVIDSENSADNDFMRKIGVNVDDHTAYMYNDATTIDNVSKLCSSFLKMYQSEYADDLDNAPKVLIVVDSLDMLMTSSQEDNMKKGVVKGDQGQKNKQIKHMLREFVQRIKHLNVTILVTSQVYKNQDVMNGEGVWMIADAVKYSASQIALLTKLKLKETGQTEVLGIRLKCEGYKTRFTKPYQKVTIEVPYDTGMDKYSGLLDVLIEMQLVKKTGGWYSYEHDNETLKFQKKTFNEHAELLLAKLSSSDVYLQTSSKEIE